MNIEDLKSIMDAFDPASLLPEMEGVLNALTVAVRLWHGVRGSLAVYPATGGHHMDCAGFGADGCHVYPDPEVWPAGCL